MNMEFIVLSNVSLGQPMATVSKMFPKVGKDSIFSPFSKQWNRFGNQLNLYYHFFLCHTENANSQTAKLRDRVQNISQKVDTMKLNDSHGTAKAVPALSNREFVQRDENKNTTTLSAVGGISTRRKVTPTAADIDNNNGNGDKSTTNPTQGDTLNQIKAMRRRHTRLSTNISPVSGL